MPRPAPNPPAPPPPVRFTAYGSEACVYVAAPDRVSWTARVDGDDSGWLAITGGASGRGPGLVTLSARQSTGPERTARIAITRADGTLLIAYDAIQETAVPLATLNDGVLQIPFPTTPRVMEIGIAGKFIADEIAKIPEPFMPVVLAIAEALVALLGELAIALRAALAPVVPEPLTWFGAPPPYDGLTKTLPATAVFIQQETDLLLAYLPIEVADAG